MRKRRLYNHGEYAPNGQIYNAVWGIFMGEEDFLKFDKFRHQAEMSTENAENLASGRQYQEASNLGYQPENA